MKPKIEKVYNLFIDDPDRIEKLFGSIENGLEYLGHHSPETLFNIDTNDNIWFENELQDKIIKLQLQNSKDKKKVVKNFIKNHSFNELEVEGDKIFWNLKDIDDLADLYEGNYRTIVERLLSDDYFDWYEPDYYELSEMLGELNKENTLKLENYVIENLNGKISSEDIEDKNILLLDEMMEIQGNPNTLEIDSENVSDILDDSQARNFIFKNYLEDLEDSLRSSYTQANNDAYESELYKSFKSPIEYILGPMEFYDYILTTRAGNKIYRKGVKIDVTNTIENIFSEYFSTEHYQQIDYFGSFLNMFKEYEDENNVSLDFTIPDYPDYREVNTIFNDIVEI